MAMTYENATNVLETHRFLICSSPDQWADFLRVSCKFESYSFNNQIMITAQRVNPTAVADYNHWNEVQECSVIKGRKGIALFNESGSGLRYVFDAADVRECHSRNKNGHKPVLWTLEDRHHDMILDGLRQRYGDIDIISDKFEDKIKAYTNRLVGEYLFQNEKLLNMDEKILNIMFASVEFAVLNRMGFAPSTDNYPVFNDIVTYAMNEEVISAIGLVTQQVSFSMLKEIGREIHDYDLAHVSEIGYDSIINRRKDFTDQFIAAMENKANIGLANAPEAVHNVAEAESDSKTGSLEEVQSYGEQSDLHEGGRLSLSEHRSEPAAGRTTDEVRQSEERLSDATRRGTISDHAGEGNLGSSLSGNSENGRGEARGIDSADGTGRRDIGSSAEPGSDGMGSADDIHSGSSRRNRPSRDSLRLEFTGEELKYEQLSLFAPDEEEQIGTIMAKGSYINNVTSFAFSLSSDQIDNILRTGGGRNNSRERIYAKYQQGKTPEEMAAFLQQEYKTVGKGFEFDGNMISVWFDESGMTIGQGNSAIEMPIMVMSWNEVEGLIRSMVENGTYMNASEVSLVDEVECKRVSNSLYYFFQDGIGEYPESLFYEPYNYPKSIDRLSELLSTAEGRELITKELFHAKEQLDTGEKRLKWRYVNSPEYLLSEVADLNAEKTEYPALETVELKQEDFITQDEIDAFLTRGSGFEHGLFRIYDYYMEGHDSKDAVKFLKNEYGTGGRSPAIVGTDNSHDNHDAKGIRLHKGSIMNPYSNILLKWNVVEKRIRKLIEEDRYLSPAAKEEYAAYKEEQAQKALEQEQARIERKKELAVPGTEQIIVTLTVAESEEFHGYGEYHEGIGNVEEAISLFNQIPPERLHAIPSIGINVHTVGTENYKDTQIDIYSGNTFNLEVLDYVPEVAENEQAIAFIKELMDRIPEAKVIGSLPGNIESSRQEINADSSTLDDAKASGEDYAAKLSVGENVEEKDDFLDNIDTEAIREKIENGEAEKEAGIMLKMAEQTARDSAEAGDVPIDKTGAVNFHITNDRLGVGTTKQKFRWNMDAIQTLKQIEAENRIASPEEQEILSEYVGWGGLSDAFDDKKDGWSKEYTELKELLTPEEYASARRSTLDSFYTSPTIINAIYEKLSDMGFDKGNIIDPACGVGNFFGMMPDKMQQGSRIYGVELDSISGRIAQHLYPDADIRISGFENTSFSDDFFDVAIGNVPFGEIKPYDKAYAKENFLIHDYFFAKSLDKVRAGGVVAFITSKGTLDKQSENVRKYLAERAEFMGAVRLPDTAFKANAGTEVTSDIIFLKKRDMPIVLNENNMPDWVRLSADSNGISMNKYFADHPEQICGRMEMVSGPFGPVSTCRENPARTLSEQLKDAMNNIHGTIEKSFIQIQSENNHEVSIIPADDNVRNFSYTVVDDKVYFRRNSVMEEVEGKPDTLNRIKGMCAIREAVQDVLNIQIEDSSNETAFKTKQNHLNAVYDSFEKTYGRIASKSNKKAFENDTSYCLLKSLEKYDEDGNFKDKAAVFTKRTVKPIVHIESCDNSLDALFASLSERAVIDFDYMSSLCGRSKDEMLSDLTGIIFQNPETQGYETAEEYLSGNVRKKLEYARDIVEHGYNEYSINVKYLEQVQPEELKASEIAVRLGATWIEPEYINQFMKEVFEMPERLFRKPYYWRQDSLSDCGVTMNEYTNEWTVRGKHVYTNAIIDSTYGTSRRSALQILEDSLNLKDSRVYDTVYDPNTQKERRELNQKETIIAQQKQELLKERFNDWIFADPDRREYLVAKYNNLFNSTRPRTYDGSHLTFSGISNGITLNPHQKDAIARILYGGNTLLAHAVGAGKTYEMTAAAMESKRLGLCNKSLFVVPNHLTEQWGASFMKLYPNANILVATKKDFEPANRKEFCSRIATGEYDAVIIGHTQFERIPLSAERIAISMERQISDIQSCIDATLEAEGKKSPSVKQLEKQKQSLERKLKELNDAPKDDVVTFEQLGVDRLFVDESHNFKNLYTYTKMRNVAGISTTEAKKSTDLYQKCQYLDDITGGKGIIFASGTPISNSMTELFTNMRYLQSQKLKDMNLMNFDAWASTFGETQTAMELAPEGTGYRSKMRFAKFFNLPELMNIFKEAADVKTSDMLDLDVPEAVYEDVVIEPSTYQKDIVASLAERAEKVRGGSVDPHHDNMLKITNDGRMAALDQRLINPMLPDEPDSKVNKCVEKSFKIWEDTKVDKLTQVIFCDLSTPSKDGKFNVYDDIKQKLIARGVPEKEIAFIHDADTEVKKANLFGKVRSGEVRFILGSTPKLGAGTNIQHKLVALHHLDVPWRPSDIEQQEGRIVRQHNQNDKVNIFRYITKDTFDAYSWQLIENKQKFIGQIMTSKSPVRMADDVDEQALNYAEIKALATGNPLIKEKMDLDVQVNKLKMLKSAYQSSIFQMQDNISKVLPQRIARNEEMIADLKKDIAVYAERKKEMLERTSETQPELLLENTPTDKVSENESAKDSKEPFEMQIRGVTYDSRGKAGEALIEACRNIKTANTAFEVGEFCGFKIDVTFDALNQKFVAALQGNRNYSVELDSSAIGNSIRIKNVLENLGKELDAAEKRLSDAKSELETAQKEVNKPFPKEEEYQEKITRLLEVNRLLEQKDDDSERRINISQLVTNIDYVIDNYLREMDDNDAIPLTEEELIDLCKSQIFDIMNDGMGSCRKEPGICDNLKSLGNDVIEQKILEHGQEVLKDKGITLDSMKFDLSQKKADEKDMPVTSAPVREAR